MATAANDAICIGCGCSEFDPCAVKHHGMQSTCAWVVVDRRAGRGVCCTNQCRTQLQRWDRGDREPTAEAKQRAARRLHG